MDYILFIQDFILENLEMVLLVIIGLLLITAISFVMVNVKLSKVIKRYNDLAQGMDSVNLEELLVQYMSSLKEVRQQGKDLLERVEFLQGEEKKAIKKIGCIRYDAFEGSGGELSFSLALLNDEDTGVVITSIYGREESRIYLKPLSQGTSQLLLSPEEDEAIKKARMA